MKPALVTGGALALLAAALIAQQPPEGIPASDIARRAEETTKELGAIRSRLAGDSAIVRIEQDLPPFAKALEALQQAPEGRALEEQGLRSLEIYGREWLPYRAQLEGWRETLEERAAAASADRERLRELHELWERTGERAARDRSPAVLRQRVGAVLEETVKVDAELGQRLNNLLALQGRVAREAMTVADVLGRIDAARAAARERLLTQDSPPLWQALAERPDEESLSAQARSVWRTHWVTLSDFVRQRRDRALLHFVLFGVLLALLARLSQRSRSWALSPPGEEALAAPARVLGRPASAALLISLLATPWLYPRAPRVVLELASVALLVPLLRLLPSVVYANLRAPLYGLVTLYVLGELRNLALQQSLLQRLLLLLVTALAFAGAAWFVRPAGPATRLARGPWWQAALTFSRVGLLTLGVSLLANFFGMVGLANLLTGGTLASAYLAVVLFAGALVLGGVVRALVYGRLARSLKSVRDNAELLERRGLGFTRFAAVTAWALGTLAWFRLLAPLWDGLKAVAGKSLTLGSLHISLADVLAFAVVLWVAVELARFLSFVLDEDVLPRMALPRGVPAAISVLTRYLVLALGVLAALAAAGIEMSRLALVAGALGVGIGFGLQNVVNNFVSGLILLFERPVQIGDVVEIGPITGKVQRIGIRASIVRTSQGAEVIVPNGNLISNQVINWTLSDRLRRIEVPVSVAYGADLRRVLDLLVGVGRRLPTVLLDPEPVAVLRRFGESSLECALLCWTSDSENFLKISSEVTVAVYDTLRQAGIEIPFPQRDLHLRSIAAPLPGSPAESAGKTVSDP